MSKYSLYTSAHRNGPYLIWGTFNKKEKAIRIGMELQDMYGDNYTPCYILIIEHEKADKTPRIIKSLKLLNKEGYLQ